MIIIMKNNNFFFAGGPNTSFDSSFNDISAFFCRCGYATVMGELKKECWDLSSNVFLMNFFIIVI